MFAEPWLLVLSLVVLILTCLVTYQEIWFISGVLLIVHSIILALFGDFNLFSEIIAHPLEAVLVLAGYLGIGIIWSTFKWYIFLVKAKNKFINFRKEFFSNPKNVGISQDKFLEIAESRSVRYKPKATEFKSNIVGWMAFWPFSLIATLLGDFVKDIFEFIYEKFRNCWQKISDYVWQDVD